MHARNILVREARTAKGKSGREVARLVNMTESMVSKLENGHLPVTDETLGRYFRAEIITAEQLTDALRVDKDAA
jgi:transcriptional regulator with XRE-family HTH domain